MFCNKCGNKIEDGAAFCVMCGSSIGLNNMSMNQNVKTKKKRKWPIIVIAICLISIVVSIFSTVYLRRSENMAPVEVTERYVKAIEKKDFEEFSKCYHPSVNKVNKELFDEIIDSFEDVEFSIGKRENFSKKDLDECKQYFEEQYNVNISDACIVNMDLSSEGEKFDFDSMLIKIKGKWYIYKFV